MLKEIICIRHRLHQMPELKYEEIKTAELVAETLKSFGIEIKTGVAKTGITAIIDSEKPGKTVALRADMDALPIQEITGLPYQSQHENKMHACGHDGHTATLLLTAHYLQQQKDQFQGKIKLIFQPAEEGGKGSSAMIAEGVLNDVDAIFGWHVWPGLELGKIGTKSGTILVGNGRFEIIINGRIAHTSMPQHAINPVTVGAELISAIDSLREYYRDLSSIINVIRFECSDASSGMAQSAKIIGVYYIENENILAKIKLDIENKIQSIAHSSGASIEIKYTPFHSPTINTKKETELTIRSVSESVSSNHIVEFSSALIASEDFSEYLKIIPGCFFLIGAGVDSPRVHTNMFDFPDEIISIAALTMSKIAMNYLNSE